MHLAELSDIEFKASHSILIVYDVYVTNLGAYGNQLSSCLCMHGCVIRWLQQWTYLCQQGASRASR